MIVYHYILYTNIFHEAAYFSVGHAIVTQPYQWTVVELRINKSIHGDPSFR